MTRSALASALIALLFSTSCKRSTAPAAAPALEGVTSGDIGLDHAGLAVRDLAAAEQTLRDQLGFGGLEAGHLANGIDNVIYYFEDGTYLETLSARDAAKAEWLSRFTAAREGLVFFALATASLDATARWLSAQGLESGPQLPGSTSTARNAASAPLWTTMFPRGGPLPEGALFFISYAAPGRAEHLRKLAEARASGRIYRHPNGALGIKAVWLAVRDLDASTRQLTAMGFVAGAQFALPQLGARGRAIELNRGKLLLLTPEAASGGALAAFLQDRGEALCGLSIEVTRLGVAQRLAARALGHSAPEYPGPLGRSALVEPSVAHGAWLEFFER